jgi:hypothetical protein
MQMGFCCFNSGAKRLFLFPYLKRKNMKRFLLIVLMLVAGQGIIFAQGVEITPFGGYVFPSRWNAYEGSLYFNGAAQYGGIISVGVNPAMDVSFIYNRIDTKAKPEVYGYNLDGVALSENYYMIGFTKNFRVKPNVSPFASFNLGGVYMAPKESGYYSYWFFAMGMDAGAKIYFNDVVGIRLQAQLMMPVQSGGFSFYYGTGGGGSSVYMTSTKLDFGFTGGLIFRVGRK